MQSKIFINISEKPVHCAKVFYVHTSWNKTNTIIPCWYVHMLNIFSCPVHTPKTLGIKMSYKVAHYFCWSVCFWKHGFPATTFKTSTKSGNIICLETDCTPKSIQMAWTRRHVKSCKGDAVSHPQLWFLCGAFVQKGEAQQKNCLLRYESFFARTRHKEEKRLVFLVVLMYT